MDWDGRVVWEYREQREGYAPHHDWVRIFNKKLHAPTTLYIANKSISDEQAIAAGADPGNGPYDGADGRHRRGRHARQGGLGVVLLRPRDPGPRCRRRPTTWAGEKRSPTIPAGSTSTCPAVRPKRDWLHCNAVDYNAELGQVVTSSVQGEIYVIDHDKTFMAGDPQASIKAAAGPAGDFLYRFGDPARYAQGDPPRVLENWDTATAGDKQIGGCHDVHWIRPGLPGAGHILIFNNGQYLCERTAQSSIVEINPFLDAQGRDTGQLRQSARRRLRAGPLPPRHPQAVEAGLEADRVELPIQGQPGILQPYRLGLAAIAQRQHADLLGHVGASLRGDRPG